MNISIIGAGGFIGRNLITTLLETTSHSITAIDLHIESIIIPEQHRSRVTLVTASINDFDTLSKALSGSEVAYYLVHMMNSNQDFYDAESEAAHTAGKACKQVGVKKIIYLSGLGNDKEVLSQHLASRHNTGQILRSYCSCVIEFRASMVIGAGSISFEIVSSLIHRLPVLTLPRWASTRTQPIGLGDALNYLVAALDLPLTSHEVVEIGGPEKMSYQEFLIRYAAFINKKPLIIRIPFLPWRIAAWWLDLFTPKTAARVGRHMVESFKNEMIVTNDRAQKLFPTIVPKKVEESFLR